MDPKVTPLRTWKRILCFFGFHDLERHLYICERCGVRFRKSMVMPPSKPHYD